jgi:hypothetical protein
MYQDFKTEIKLFVIVAFIAAVVSVGGVFLLRGLSPAPAEPTPPVIPQVSPPAPAPQPQVLDTNDLHTYRNKEFGFEFVLPYEGFTFVLIDKQSSFNEYADKFSEDFEKVTVAGVPAIQGVRYWGGESGAFVIATYIDLTPEAVISLNTWTNPDDDEKSRENLRQHEKVLSTFRVIDPDDLSFLEDSFSAWGTYEGYLGLETPTDFERIDFTVEYPLNWVVGEIFHDVFISTFADGHIQTIYAPLVAEGSLDQDVAAMSIKALAKNSGYSLDKWIGNVD